MALGTPPPDNLGPMSRDWGRWATDQAKTNAEQIERMGGDASNDGRLNNTTLDSIGVQVTEISSRQSSFTQAEPMTTAPFNGAGTDAPMIVREIQVPRPKDAPRSGWLAVSFDVSQTTDEFSVAFLTIYIDGRVFHKNSVGFPTNLVTPPAWGTNSNISAFTGYIAAPDFGGLLRIELTPGATSGTPLRTITASNFQVTNQYSQKA